MIQTVIPDTGPLISLARIDRLDLLDGLNSQILITDAVEFGFMNGREDTPDLANIEDWIARGGNRLRHRIEVSWFCLKTRVPGRWISGACELHEHMVVRNGT